MLYDSDGAEHSYTSGEIDDAASDAVAVLKEVGAPVSPVGTYPAASHVEVKAAAAMRRGEVKHGVLVINHPNGAVYWRSWLHDRVAPGPDRRVHPHRVVAERARDAISAVHRRARMTRTAQQPRAWADFGVNRHGWVASGVFQVGDANYECEFRAEPELRRFLDFLMASPTQPATSRLYLHQSAAPLRPEHYLSNLRFQFDVERDVAAAVVLLIDRNHDDEQLAWMTHGVAGRSDVALAHDSWNAEETLFPAASHITLAQLREVVAEWAYGEVVPPAVVRWSAVSDITWF